MAERVLELPICWKYVLPKEGGGSYEPMPHFPLSLSGYIKEREISVWECNCSRCCGEGGSAWCVCVRACVCASVFRLHT